MTQLLLKIFVVKLILTKIPCVQDFFAIAITNKNNKITIKISLAIVCRKHYKNINIC